ncbi:MAG: 16S rRNA (cytosine(1402)-N(4))-methyltransferase RsmH [Nostocoides sp.]
MTTRGHAADRHVPVLRDRVVALLGPALTRPGACFVDATLGMGGHSAAVLAAWDGVRVVGIDRDEEALALAGERLATYADRLDLAHEVYDQIGLVLDRLGLATYDAGLFDLGVSSLQLDEADRGFAYAQEAPLDMRMDQSRTGTAADVLNTYPVADLERILRDYGEERYARAVATAIDRERRRAPFTSSARLVDLLRTVIPAASQRQSGHPAKRTFQALRIEVNSELDALRGAIPAALDRLAVGGRLVVLAYHSIEDRIVKQAFAAASTSSAPRGLPVELPEHAPRFALVTRGAEPAPTEEIANNSRAASVRLRCVERIR